MSIAKNKLDTLNQRLEKLHVRPEDLIEKFILGSGPGGQKVNKTASTVYLKHLPTGIEVKCGRERSRELNRFLARRELCERIERELFGIKSDKEKKGEKIRKQKIKRKKRHLKTAEENSPI